MSTPIPLSPEASAAFFKAFYAPFLAILAGDHQIVTFSNRSVVVRKMIPFGDAGGNVFTGLDKDVYDKLIAGENPSPCEQFEAEETGRRICIMPNGTATYMEM